MELDEFKTYWNTIQDKEFEQQKLTKNKLDRIMMKITDTLDQLHQKSVYRNKISRTVCQMLIGMLFPFLLIMLIKDYFVHGKNTVFSESFAHIVMSLLYVAIIVVYCLVTMWVSGQWQQIFTLKTHENLKEALRKTINSYKRFYVKFNIIYLFLYPTYYYAIIKLFVTYWTPSTNTILLTCGILTIASLGLGHLYYKKKSFNKIKMLEANLKELEEGV